MYYHYKLCDIMLARGSRVDASGGLPLVLLAISVAACIVWHPVPAVQLPAPAVQLSLQSAAAVSPNVQGFFLDKRHHVPGSWCAMPPSGPCTV